MYLIIFNLKKSDGSQLKKQNKNIYVWSTQSRTSQPSLIKFVLLLTSIIKKKKSWKNLANYQVNDLQAQLYTILIHFIINKNKQKQSKTSYINCNWIAIHHSWPLPHFSAYIKQMPKKQIRRTVKKKKCPTL